MRFKIEDSKTVKELQDEFKKEFGGCLRVKEDGYHLAEENATLASIGAKSGDIECTDGTTVGEFEKLALEQCDLHVRVFTPDDWVAVLPKIALINVSDLPSNATKIKMEEFLSLLSEENEEDREEEEDEKKGLPEKYEVCAKELLKYNKRWEKSRDMEDYRSQEDALDLLFHKLCPLNYKMEDILLKIVALNDFYSTNIYDVYSVARHYMKVSNLDSRMDAGDDRLVDKLAKVKMKNGKTKLFFSFATKYCSHHNPECYPIYDRYVCDVLKALRKLGKVSKFRNEDLKNYRKFKSIIDECIKNCNLVKPDGKPFTYKEVDRYLWLLGKDYFNAYK